ITIEYASRAHVPFSQGDCRRNGSEARDLEPGARPIPGQSPRPRVLAVLGQLDRRTVVRGMEGQTRGTPAARHITRYGRPVKPRARAPSLSGRARAHSSCACPTPGLSGPVVGRGRAPLAGAPPPLPQPPGPPPRGRHAGPALAPPTPQAGMRHV